MRSIEVPTEVRGPETPLVGGLLNQAYHREYVPIWLEIKKEWGLSLAPLEASVIQSIVQE